MKNPIEWARGELITARDHQRLAEELDRERGNTFPQCEWCNLELTSDEIEFSELVGDGDDLCRPCRLVRAEGMARDAQETEAREDDDLLDSLPSADYPSDV